MFNLLLELSGVVVFLLNSIIFHLVVFRKPKFISILVSFIFGTYILTAASLILGIFISSNAYLIFATSAILTIIFGIIIKKKIKRELDVEGINPEGRIIKGLGWVALFVLIVWLFQKNIAFFGGDSFYAYMPWARIITEQGIIPAFHIQNNARLLIDNVPLIYTQAAYLFGFIKSFDEAVPAALPLVYTAMAFLLMIYWAKHYSKTSSDHILLILIGTPIFMYYSTYVGQEAPILFFATATLYFLFEYIKERKDVFLALTVVSSLMVSLTKQEGIILSAMIYLYLVFREIKYENIKKVTFYHLIIFIPLIIWLGRNYYFYSNPFVIYFNSIFKDPLLEFFRTNPEVIPGAAYQGILQSKIYSAFIFSLSIIILGALHCILNRKKIEVKITLLFLVIYLLALNTWGYVSIRYIFLFFGIFAIFAATELEKIFDFISFSKKSLHDVLFTGALIITLLLTPLVYYYPHGTFFKHLNPFDINKALAIYNPFPKVFAAKDRVRFVEDFEIIEYLENKEGNKKVRILGYSEPIVWYGQHTVMHPSRYLFYYLNNGSLDYSGSVDYYYNTFKNIGVSYIYSSPRVSLQPVIDEISFDSRFELVFDKNGIKLWKIK